MAKNIYISVIDLRKWGISPAYNSHMGINKALIIQQGGQIHQSLMAQGVVDWEGNILPKSSVRSKSMQFIKHYGEWFLQLLDNHHYCLRRNLYDTHPHLFMTWGKPVHIYLPNVQIHYSNN